MTTGNGDSETFLLTMVLTIFHEIPIHLEMLRILVCDGAHGDMIETEDFRAGTGQQDGGMRRHDELCMTSGALFGEEP